jgi:hypothetical protein
LNDVTRDRLRNGDRGGDRVEFVSLKHDQATFGIQLPVGLTSYRKLKSLVGVHSGDCLAQLRWGGRSRSSTCKSLPKHHAVPSACHRPADPASASVCPSRQRRLLQLADRRSMLSKHCHGARAVVTQIEPNV